MLKKSIKDTLIESGFRFNKRYGQNFISDKNLLRAIVEDAEISDTDNVLEIGAGGGALTGYIAEYANKVLSYEIDAGLKAVLEKTLAEYDNIELVFEDFMRIDGAEIYKRLGKRFKVVANLPYYITTPVIMKLLENKLGDSLTIMVQEEVAERLLAAPGEREYGAITAQINLIAEVRLLRKVSRSMFFPSPNVDSALIRILPKDKYCGKDKQLTQRIIKAAFAMRRKTLVNNLIADLLLPREQVTDIVMSANLGENIRGEMLSVDKFIELSDYFFNEVYSNENFN